MKDTLHSAFERAAAQIQIAVIVFVKFVEFVASKKRHEFHQLTRIKFSTVSERVKGRMN